MRMWHKACELWATWQHHRMGSCEYMRCMRMQIFSQVAKLVIYLSFFILGCSTTTDIDRNSAPHRTNTYAAERFVGNVAMIFPLFMFRLPPPWYRYTHRHRPESNVTGHIKCMGSCTAQLTHTRVAAVAATTMVVVVVATHITANGEPIWNEIDNRNYCHQRVSNVRSQSYPNWIVRRKKLNEVTASAVATVAARRERTNRHYISSSLTRHKTDMQRDIVLSREIQFGEMDGCRTFRSLNVSFCVRAKFSKRWFYLRSAELPIEIIHRAHTLQSPSRWC